MAIHALLQCGSPNTKIAPTNADAWHLKLAVLSIEVLLSKDGTIETWEIYLNPTIGARPRASTNRIPPEIQPLRRAAKEHFYRRFRSALESLDSTADAPPLPIRFAAPRPSTPRALTRQEPNLRRPVLRKLLRPLRKPIDRLASLFAPLFMTLSRRRRQAPRI